ncbi:MAG: hypothetical protein EOP84_33115, partial [Verrucomicrobiaceae bacterium]
RPVPPAGADRTVAGSGIRRSTARTYINTFVVFGLSGLWHGADWKFIIWGLLHGLYLTLGQMMNKRTASRKQHRQTEFQLNSLVGHRTNQLLTFLLVTLTWVFFRAATTADALLVVRAGGRVPRALRHAGAEDAGFVVRRAHRDHLRLQIQSSL